VHHSQEELSILTTYRAHPLVHVSFSSGLAWTVLVVEAAGVVMLVLTAALLWQRRA